MPSYVAVRTIDNSRPDGGLVTKIRDDLAHEMVKRSPNQYEIVAPTKVTVDPPKKTEAAKPKPCVGCGK